eukprot:3333883-Pleurochrysis_carterae.AAC.1
MSSSGHRIAAAAARSAVLSICLAPANSVCRVERCTGAQRRGSPQSHTMPRVHGAISDCSMTTVGTAGTST